MRLRSAPPRSPMPRGSGADEPSRLLTPDMCVRTSH